MVFESSTSAEADGAMAAVSCPVLLSEKALHDAAKRNEAEKMQELIRMGVNVRAKNKVSV